MASTPQPWVELDKVSTRIPLYVIHNELDTVFTLADIETAVKSLEDRGANIKLVVIPQLQHENIFQTMPFLYETIDWLNTEVWQ